jgi:hypothetical protein
LDLKLCDEIHEAIAWTSGLPKRRKTLGGVSHLNGDESWADSPRKYYKGQLNHGLHKKLF